MRRLASVLALSTLTLSGSALAQSDLDLDNTDDRRAAKREARQRDLSATVVREIERGFYVKGNIGTTIYIGPRSPLLRAGTTLNVVLGGDVIDKPKASLSIDFTIYQAIHNSTFAEPGDQTTTTLSPNLYIQGDTHVFAGMIGIEGSGYPVRRLGIGGHAGGGVGFAPVLLGKGPNGEYYADVLNEFGVTSLPVHQGILPVVYAGPTIEYYTKLSHFSVGLDADFLYFIGLDYGVMITGYVKYTF